MPCLNSTSDSRETLINHRFAQANMWGSL